MKVMFKTLIVGAVVAAITLPFIAHQINSGEELPAVLLPENLTNKVSVLDTEFLASKLNKKLGMTINKVEASPIPGIALLITEQGIVYTSYDGDFLIQGNMYSLGDSVVNLTESSFAQVRLNGLKRFEGDTIDYKAENEKYVVTVFTDITCGYCRKMHGQMADYNARGITFKYLAYPRSGINDRLGNLSQGYKDLRSIWCSDDNAKAMTLAKSGDKVEDKVCETSIEAQFDFGRKVGVNGTPAMILSNGTMIPGYQPPAKLEAILKKS
jgi:thiol:disulfide interchange protein DsbC